MSNSDRVAAAIIDLLLDRLVERGFARRDVDSRGRTTIQLTAEGARIADRRPSEPDPWPAVQRLARAVDIDLGSGEANV